MPIRGENIGAAFVRLIIDGAKVPRDVEDALQEADGEFDAAGKRQGERHAKALRKSMTNKGLTNQDADKFIENLRNRIDAGMETLGKDSGSSFFERFRKSVITEIGDGRLADQMIANFERDFARSGFNADFTKLFGLDEDRLRSNADATKEWTARIQEATKALQAQDKQLDRDIDLLGKRLKIMRTETERVTRGQLREFEHLGDAINMTKAEIVEMDRELVRLSGNLDPALVREYTREINALDRSLDSRTLITYNRNVNSIGTTVGRVFGRGSRSELLNFFGRVAEFGTRAFLGIGSALLALPSAIRRVTSLVGDLVSGFAQAGEGAGILARIGASLGAAGINIGAVAASAAAAVAAVVALSLAMGALSTLVISVVGVLGALVATLGGALVGALGIAAGAMLPLVAGIGITVAAFKSMDDAAKKSLKDSLQPLTDKFKELGGIAASNIFPALEAGAKSLVAAFDTPAVTQFVDQISIAVGTIIEQFGLALESPQFQGFVEILSNTLPEQMINLGYAAQQFGAGFGGVLLALQPTITDLTEGLANIATNFNTWANSTQGQTTLMKFFEKAQRALVAIGGFVWDVGEALLELFKGEAGTIGIEIFEAMRKKVQEFTDYLRDPENREEIERFFRDAKRIGQQVWDIVENILGTFRKFGGPDNRADLMRLLRWIENITAAVEDLAGILSKISVTGTLRGLASILPGVGPLIGAHGMFNADGARNFQGGWSWVGEEGPELIKVPGGSNIYSNPESMSMTRNSNVNIEIRNYGPQTGADIAEQIDWNIRFGATYGPTSALAG